MSLHPLPTGDTLVLEGRMTLPADFEPVCLLADAGAADITDVVMLEMFAVVSSNASATDTGDAMQVHISLPAGFLAHGPNVEDTVRRAQGLLAACFPSLTPDLSAFQRRRFTGISRLATGVVEAPYAAYRYVLACDVAPEAEAEINQWYDDEHLPGLASVPGVQQARRDLCRYDSPRYRACYDVDQPDTVGCEAWLAVRHTPWTTRMIRSMHGVQRTMLRRLVTVCADSSPPPLHRG